MTHTHITVEETSRYSRRIKIKNYKKNEITVEEISPLVLAAQSVLKTRVVQKKSATLVRDTLVSDRTLVKEHILVRNTEDTRSTKEVSSTHSTAMQLVISKDIYYLPHTLLHTLLHTNTAMQLVVSKDIHYLPQTLLDTLLHTSSAMQLVVSKDTAIYSRDFFCATSRHAYSFYFLAP
jgi:hypothetical protein